MSDMSDRDPDGVKNDLSAAGGEVVQARDVSGGIHFHGSVIPVGSIPRQLPPDVRGFVNRVKDLERLDAVVAPTERDPRGVAVCVVVGTAGVGKTSLVVHWAHQVVDRFPDGQFYVNLHGYDPELPVAPGEVLDQFLRTMGVPVEAIPSTVESRSALYRSILAGRKVLIVLDNASSSGQVRPLVPGASGCLVLVTSRTRLSGLIARDGAFRISVDLLTRSQAVELLSTVIRGYRFSDDTDNLEELARLCARLPLALRIAAERAISRPHMPLRNLIADLRDESSLWDALTTEEDDESEAVRAVFAWSYRALSADACRLFRLLGLHPGSEFGAAAAAAIVDMPLVRVRRLLDDLVGAHLLEQVQPDRFQFHDLLRAYAADQARRDEPVEVTRAAVRRVLVWYLRTSTAAVQAMIPQAAAKLDFVNPGGEVAGSEFTDYDSANSWYLRERANLVAATRLAGEMSMHDLAWQLPAVLHDAYADRNQFDDWLAAGAIGLGAARRAGDRLGEAKLLASLGTAQNQRGNRPEGIRLHSAALTAHRELGDRLGELRSVNEIALAHLRGHRLDEALTGFHEANSIATEFGNSYWIAVTTGNIAHTHLGLDQFEEAVSLFEQALLMCGRLGDRIGEGDAFGALAEAHRRLGQPGRAEPLIDDALRIAREHDNRVLEGYWSVIHGRVQADLGNLSEALESHRRAAALHRRIGDRVREAEALDATGEVYARLDRPDDGANFHRMAVAILREFDEQWLLAAALDNLATALDRLGAATGAKRTWSEALRLLVPFPDARSLRMQARIRERLAH